VVNQVEIMKSEPAGGNLNNNNGMAVCRFVLAATLAGTLAGRLKCAEFEVMDVLRVDGYAVLESSVDITGNAFSVDGSALVVAGGKVGIGTVSPSAGLDVQKYTAGQFTARISTSATAGQYSIAVSSTGATNINNLVIENREADPASPVTGQIWLRTN